MKTTIVKLVIIILMSGLIGCSNKVNNAPAVASLKVNHKIPVPQGSSRLFFQNGARANSVNLFKPYCEIETTDLSHGSSYLKPDKFKITDIYHARTGSELTGFPAPLFGGFDRFGRIRCDDEAYYETHFKLYAAKQLKVKHMVCREQFDACSGKYLTMSEIRKILGSDFELEIR